LQSSLAFGTLRSLTQFTQQQIDYQQQLNTIYAVFIRDYTCYSAPVHRGLRRVTEEIMRATKLNKLTAIQLNNAKPNGVLSDGGRLYWRSGVWVFRYTSPLTGKETDLSLGSAASVALNAGAFDRGSRGVSVLARQRRCHP
jgi:hypothetical protein